MNRSMLNSKNLLILIIAITTLFLLFYKADLLNSKISEVNFDKQAFINHYDTLLKNLNTKPVPDNTSGKLAWNWSYILESLVEMYRATHDKKYLDIFVHYADEIMEKRADISGELDWRNKTPKGWLTNGHYTISKPIVIRDKNGEPSLKLIANNISHNNFTEFKIEVSNNKSFSLEVKNSQLKGHNQKYEKLNLANVIERVDPNPLIDVSVLGNNLPAATEKFLIFETNKMVIHGHHTSVISVPYLLFVKEVYSKNLITYKDKADKYLARVEESVLDMEHLWVDEGEAGYYIFEKGSPYWADGLPEPYNTMSASGRLFLLLYKLTKKNQYKERVTKIANLIKKGLVLKPNNSYSIKYWYGLPSLGWDAKNSPTTYYKNYKGNKAFEDISHGQFLIAFISDAVKDNLCFTKLDRIRLINTFNKNVWLNHSNPPFLATTLEGVGRKGKYDFAMHKFLHLAEYDSSIHNKCLYVYNELKKRNLKLPNEGIELLLISSLISNNTKS